MPNSAPNSKGKQRGQGKDQHSKDKKKDGTTLVTDGDGKDAHSTNLPMNATQTTEDFNNDGRLMFVQLGVMEDSDEAVNHPDSDDEDNEWELWVQQDALEDTVDDALENATHNNMIATGESDANAAGIISGTSTRDMLESIIDRPAKHHL